MRQYAAPGITGNDIWADLLFHRAEMMAVVQHARLHAVPFLDVNARRLASHVVINARSSHQVALVGRVDEHFAGVTFAAERRDRGQVGAVLLHAILAVEPFVAMDGDLVFPDQLFKNLFCDVRLEDPHRALLSVNRRRALPLIAILLALLPLPGRGSVIMLPDAAVKLARQTADDRFVASVSETQTAAGEAAQMLVRRDDDDRLAHPFCLYRRRDRRGSAPVNDQVVL